MHDNCRCPSSERCHLGRRKGQEEKELCGGCINLWFDEHLQHKVEQFLDPREAEAKYIAGRGLLQFLGLSSAVNPAAREYVLKLEDSYKFVTPLVAVDCPHCGHRAKVTYEVRANNLGGNTFTGEQLKEFEKAHPREAAILARFHQGACIHTAHLTWGANHPDCGVVWNESGPDDGIAVKALCDLLELRVYKARPLPWKKGTLYTLKTPRRIA